MNRATRLLTILAIGTSLLIPTSALSQVDKIKRDVERDKSSSSSSSSRDGSSESSDCCGSFLAAELIGKAFIGLFELGSQAQEAALSHRAEHPELVSAEIMPIAGMDFKRSASVISPTLKLNRGIFATEFRYAKLKDNTGKLQSIDWQVLKFRVPIQNVKLEYGIGFTNLVDMNKSYFESSLGFDWRLNKIGANVRANYRWCQNTSLNSRYREEANLSIDYEITTHKSLHVSPMVGITYQNYFASNEFTFYQVGVVFRFF